MNKSNVSKIQTFQNINLRKIDNVTPYISYLTLHSVLKIKKVHEETIISYQRYNFRFHLHPNPIISILGTLTIPRDPQRRL